MYLDTQSALALNSYYKAKGFADTTAYTEPYGFDIHITFQPIYNGIILDGYETVILSGESAEALQRDAKAYLDNCTREVERTEQEDDVEAYEYAVGCLSAAEKIVEATEEWLEENE